MKDLQMIGRQMLMLQKKLEMLTQQNAADEQKEGILNQMKVLGEEAIAENNNPSSFVIYITAIKNIFTTYNGNQNFLKAEDIILEAIEKLEPFYSLIDQEQYANIIVQHLNFATINTLDMLKQYQEPDEKLLAIVFGLADLSSQGLSHLSRVNPSNMLVTSSGNFLHMLSSNGFVGNSPCEFYNLKEWMGEINDIWCQYKKNNITRQYYRKWSETNINPNPEVVDKYLSPLFDSIDRVIDYDAIINNLSVLNQNKDTKGVAFLNAFLNYMFFYKEYCKQKNIQPQEFETLYINWVIPYTFSTVIEKYHKFIRQSFISLADTFDSYRETLTHQIDKDDAMLDVAEICSDENLQGMIIAVVEANIEAEGILLDNIMLFLKAERCNDDEVAMELNKISDFLFSNHFLLSPIIYGEKDVKDILDSLPEIYRE